jgi:hypothetical protein
LGTSLGGKKTSNRAFKRGISKISSKVVRISVEERTVMAEKFPQESRNQYLNVYFQFN